MELQDRVALVTGADGGIARAACPELARAGARIVVVDHDRDRGEETVACIADCGGTAVFVAADVTQVGEVKGYVDRAMRAFGRIDAFINNAGIEGAFTPLVDYPEDVFDRVISVNLRGVFLGLKYVLPVMLRRQSGSIVNTASSAGLHGDPGLSAYSASKHAVVGLTRTAALDVAKAGLRVNALCPGCTNTRMMHDIEGMANPANPRQTAAAFAVAIPNGHYNEPEDVARAVLFLVSDASRTITGVALPIDGGFTAA